MAFPLIREGRPASEQQANFMNATLQTVGDQAVSVAVHLPDHMQDLSRDELITALLVDFKHLTAIGYAVEIQIGEDDE